MNKKYAKEIIADHPDKIAGYAAVIEEVTEVVLKKRLYKLLEEKNTGKRFSLTAS